PWVRFDYQTSHTRSFTHGNGEYHYRVAACADAESCGALSSEVTTTVLLPPDPPTLYPPSYSRPDFTVKWSEPPTATSYRLEESFDGSAWTVVYNGSGTSIDFTGRLVGQYRYRVRACNLTCGDRSAIITHWVIPQRAPNLAGSVHSNGDHSLSWAAMQGVTWYELDEKSAFVWMRVHSGPETTKLLPGREAGTYLYRIRACSDGGCSDWGTEFQLVNQTQPPPAVPSLSVTSDSGSSFTVSWNAVAGVTSYRLESALMAIAGARPTTTASPARCSAARRRGVPVPPACLQLDVQQLVGYLDALGGADGAEPGGVRNVHRQPLDLLGGGAGCRPLHPRGEEGRLAAGL